MTSTKNETRLALEQQRCFLSTAAEALASSLAFDDALQRTIAAALPELGDFGFFDVIDDTEVRRTVCAHQAPDIEAMLRPTRWMKQESMGMNVCALSSGEAAFHAEIDRAWYERVASSPEHLQFFEQLGFRSMMSVPVRLRGELVGSLTLFMSFSGRRYTEEHLALAKDLAALAAPIVVNAKLLERHQKTEAALKASEERLRLAVKAGDLGIWDWDVVHDRVSWSERVYRLHGLPLGGFGGRVADFGRLIHPEDAERVQACIHAALAGQSNYDIEFRVVHPDGTVRWLATKADVHRAPDGAPLRMVGATSDVTDKVELLAAERQARAQAERAVRAKDEFLAMLGHELRNPLAPIVTTLKLMALKNPEWFGDERRLIERHVVTLSRLVDDLLDVARITRGEIQLKRAPLHLKECVRQAIEIASPLFETKRHHLEVALPPHDPLCDGDECRIVQILSNLLTNAARYTSVGGRVELRMSIEDKACRIAVRDNGSGIAPAALPRVFDMFFQGAQGLDRAEGGLGIGLALVKSLVTLHGGSVEAHSDGVGHGSEFAVTLPLLDTSRRTESGGFMPAAGMVGSPSFEAGLRVMLVDDNRDAVECLSALLELHGCAVRCETDPFDALIAARDFRPEVAVLDIGLPGIDGYELARRLAASQTEYPCRFIALSGYGMAEDRVRSKLAGFHEHLVKPVDPDVLVEAIVRTRQQAPEDALPQPH